MLRELTVPFSQSCTRLAPKCKNHDAVYGDQRTLRRATDRNCDAIADAFCSVCGAGGGAWQVFSCNAPVAGYVAVTFSCCMQCAYGSKKHLNTPFFSLSENTIGAQGLRCLSASFCLWTGEVLWPDAGHPKFCSLSQVLMAPPNCMAKCRSYPKPQLHRICCICVLLQLKITCEMQFRTHMSSIGVLHP